MPEPLLLADDDATAELGRPWAIRGDVAETPSETPVVRAPATPLGAARIAMWGVGLIVGIPATVEVSRLFTVIVLSLVLGH